MPPRRLTSTSYLILGFLTLRSWSAYQLAEQVRRGWSDYWPRSMSGVYEEPKKLVAHGYASSERQRTGGRHRTVYQATPAGVAALRVWLAEPSDPTRLECETILRVAFAEHGDLAGLRAQIRGVAQDARERAAKYAAQGRGYLEDGGPFPERTHLNLLIGRLLAEHYAGLARWARWAEREVGAWDGVGHAAPTTEVLDALRETVALFDAVAASADAEPVGSHSGFARGTGAEEAV